MPTPIKDVSKSQFEHRRRSLQIVWLQSIVALVRTEYSRDRKPKSFTIINWWHLTVALTSSFPRQCAFGLQNLTTIAIADSPGVQI